MSWRIDSGLNLVYEVLEEPDGKLVFPTKLFAISELASKLEKRITTYQYKLMVVQREKYNLVYQINNSKDIT